MTRETRVGLLLGLAIIVIIGMILTEVSQPVVDDNTAEKPLAVDSEYYKQKDVPLEDVTFRPSGSRQDYPVVVAARDNDQPSEVDRPAIRVVAPVEKISSNRLNIAHRRPAANQRPIILDAPDVRDAQADAQEFQPQPTWQEPVVVEVSQAPSVRPAKKQPSRSSYTVVDGDSLYKIAAKVYQGKGHLYKKIYNANRDKLSSPETVVVGQKLVIPALDNKPSRSGLAAGSNVKISPRNQSALNSLRRDLALRQAKMVLRKSKQPKKTIPAKSSRRLFYVVRRGDNLTRIAKKTLKDSSDAAIQKIFEANNDKLEDRDSIVEGMKLRIPS